MSSMTRHLQRSYSTAISHHAPIKSLSQDLYKERSLKRLVNKFKNYSDSDRYVEEILEHQKQYRPDMSNEGFNIRLMLLYGKSGMFDHAQKVFDEMPERNVKRSTKTMNALLSACVSSGKIDKIEGLFAELQERLGVKPDTVSYNVVIKGCYKCGKVEKAVKIFGEMEKNGVKPDLVINFV
ncbi:hypothetical protein Leryth_026165 [Lithospermum erythrorhizon]|nr:hypothetical protein Leryth_026165 [Lithospermum erythrorhizon]